jgi:hypothetical protein
LLVANAFSGDVQLLDSATGGRRASVRLPGKPSDICLAPARNLAFVSVAQMNEVAVLKLPSLAVERRIAVGQRPQALAVTADGKRLLVANFRSGDVSVIDTIDFRETARAATGGVNLRDLAITADGKRAYVTGQIPIASRRTANPLEMWSNALFVVQLGETVTVDKPVLLDGVSPAPDPDGLTLLPEGRVAVAIGGADKVAAFRLQEARMTARESTGAHPRGLAPTPDAKELWVANELAGALSVLDAGSLTLKNTIDLGAAPQRDFRMYGRFLFNNAGLTKGGRFTCNTCHPDGGTDGLTWRFAHVPDGIEERNTKDLRGELTVTAPYRWSGHGREVEEFIQDELRGLLQSPPQSHEVLHSFWNLFSKLPQPDNAYREADGSLSASAKRGKALFDGKAGCGGCHEGELRGGTGRKAWVGTTVAALQLDVPHLHGVCGTAPYLHDGRAASLEAIFAGAGPQHLHGRTQGLTQGELAELLRYVKEL